MNKSKFLELYINCPGEVKIRMALVIPSFLENETIRITEETIQLKDMLDFYVPKYEKHGKFDSRDFNEQVLDPEVLPLTIKQTMLKPGRWDLAIESDGRPGYDLLHPIPIATDLKSGKTLLLDSNHTITSIVGELSAKNLEGITLSVVHVTGNGLEDFIPDFRILNRK
jgi:hypothetical protein